MKYWETSAFKDLQKKWYQIDKETGGTDLERGHEDGHLTPIVHGHTFVPEHEATLDKFIQDGQELLATTLDHNAAARDSLSQPHIWKGLPKKAREWFGYMVLAGLSESEARDLVGITRTNHNKTDEWRRIILQRIARKK